MKKLIIAAIAGGLALSGAAHAVVLDFVAEAAGNERGVADGTVIAYGPLNVTFSSGGAGSMYAFFDDLFEGRPAGLGVCETLTGPAPADCGNLGDDNIETGEAVVLGFSQAVTLSGFSFSGEEHFSLNASLSTLLLNGVAFTFADVFNLTAAVQAVVTQINAVTFAYGGANPAAFYVNGFSADLPLPAAAPLLLIGLAGLGFVGRRRKAN